MNADEISQSSTFLHVVFRFELYERKTKYKY